MTFEASYAAMSRKIFTICFAILVSASQGFGQLNVTNAPPYNTAQHLINNVFSDGTVTINNIQVYGASSQYGFFSNGLAGVGIDSGLVLATSALNQITTSASAPAVPAAPNNTTGLNFGFPWMGIPSNNDLLTVSQSVPGLLGTTFGTPNDVNSACAISFEFIPVEDTMRFKFVFASDEWDTYPCSSFNDVFGFFVAGPGITGTFNAPTGFANAENYAVVPNTNIPITISSINSPTSPGSCNQSYNSQYYTAGNTSGMTLNAKTVVMEIVFAVQPCQTYSFTMAIANGEDASLQSAVFMEANSFGSYSSFNANIVHSYTQLGGDSVIYEGCGDVSIFFTRTDTALLADTIPLDIFGNATMGLDYDSIPDSLFFLAGQDSFTVTFAVPNDYLIEGPETLYIGIADSSLQIGCGNFVGDTLMVVIEDPIPLISNALPLEDTVLCTEASVTFLANVSSGFPEYSYIWSTGDTLDSIVVNTPTTSTDYYVTITDACSIYTIIDTARIEIVNPPTSIFCPGDTIDCETPGAWIYVQTFDSMPDLDYRWSTGDSVPSFYVNNPLATVDYIVTVTQACAGYTLIDTFTLTLDNPPFALGVRDDTITCISDSIDIWVDVSYTTPNFSFQWSNLVTDSVQRVKPVSTQQYIVSVTDACNINTESDTITVYVINDPVRLHVDNELIQCAFDSVDLFAEIRGGYPPYSILWNSGGTDSTERVTTPLTTVYTVSVTDICQLDTTVKSANVVVRTYPDLEVIPFQDVTLLCPGMPFSFESAQIVGGSGDYVLSWTDWQDSIDYLWGRTDTNVTFRLQVADRCNLDSATSEVSVFIQEHDPLTVVLPADTAVCPGEEVVLAMSTTGGAGNNVIEWSTGDELSSINVSSKSSRTYTVTVTDACNERTEASMNIRVEAPEADFTAQWLDGLSVMLENQSAGAIQYEWFFGNGDTSQEKDPWHTYQVSQTYDILLKVYNDIGCMDSKLLEAVPPLNVFIPSGFTPNGDGLNDVFQIYG